MPYYQELLDKVTTISDEVKRLHALREADHLERKQMHLENRNELQQKHAEFAVMLADLRTEHRDFVDGANGHDGARVVLANHTLILNGLIFVTGGVVISIIGIIVNTVLKR